MSDRSFRRRAAETAALGCGLLAAALARAQLPDASAGSPFGAPVMDQGIYFHALLNEFEGRWGEGESALRWDGEAWLGTDANRLWLKSEGYDVGGTVQDGQLELLYARAVSDYADLQVGVRYDLDSAPGRAWGALGLEGLAPYFVRYSVTLYASDAGHFAGKLLLSYEWLLTQRLILEPLAELNAYTQPDPARGVASGLSDVDAGLRLRYEIVRKLAPYLGVVYQRTYGPQQPGGPTQTGTGGRWYVAAGVRAWL